MTLGLTDDKSTLVQVMAWCRQATSHYPSQGWPSSMWPCGVIRPQWVKISKQFVPKANKKWSLVSIYIYHLTHWGQVTHICVSKTSTLSSDNGLSPGQHQVIIWNNAGRLLIGPLGSNICEILIGIQAFSFKEMYLKMLYAKCHPFCRGLNMLTHWGLVTPHGDIELGQHWFR